VYYSQNSKKNYLDDFSKKDFEFRGYEEDINFSIDNISFLTSTIIDETDQIFKENKSVLEINKKNYVFISLINFLKNNYILKQNNNSPIKVNEINIGQINNTNGQIKSVESINNNESNTNLSKNEIFPNKINFCFYWDSDSRPLTKNLMSNRINCFKIFTSSNICFKISLFSIFCF